jgi:putative membrane protein
VGAPTELDRGSRMEHQSEQRRRWNRREGSNPYERFLNYEMILRDQLAIDRTILANERTFLAYVRTVLALVLAGATVIRIFEDPSLNIIGWTLVVIGVLVGGVGVLRTYRTSRRIRSALNEPQRPDSQ